MPKIFIITVVHSLVFGLGGILLDAMVLGAGYSDSTNAQSIYAWFAGLWHVLNAPASYLFYSLENYRWAWIPIQLVTSFVWANIYALAWSIVKQRYPNTN